MNNNFENRSCCHEGPHRPPRPPRPPVIIGPTGPTGPTSANSLTKLYFKKLYFFSL